MLRRAGRAVGRMVGRSHVREVRAGIDEENCQSVKKPGFSKKPGFCAVARNITVRRTFFDWLNDRTNYRRLLAPLRERILPRGPSWVYSTAACLLWLLVIEMVTG